MLRILRWMKSTVFFAVCSLLFFCGNCYAAETIGFLPFENKNSEEYNWLSYAIPDTLSLKFSGKQVLTVVEREELAGVMAKELIVSAEVYKDREKTGENENYPDFLVFGSYRVSAKEITINSCVVKTKSGETLTVDISGEVDDILILETELAVKLAYALTFDFARMGLSYSETQHFPAYRSFNTGKEKFYKGDYKEAVELCIRAQKENRYVYFPEAHYWEGRARLALYRSPEAMENRIQLQKQHIQKFKKDADVHSAAYSDLGDALKAYGQLEKAAAAYQAFIESTLNSTLCTIKVTSGKQFRLNSYSASFEPLDELAHGFIDQGKLVVLDEKQKEWALSFYDLHTAELLHRSPLEGIDREIGNPISQGIAPIVVTDNEYILFVEGVLFVVDRRSGKLLKKSDPVYGLNKRLEVDGQSLYLDPASRSGILIGTVRTSYTLQKGTKNFNKKQKSFALRFSYSGQKFITRKLYEGESLRFNKRNSKIQSMESNGNVYFEELGGNKKIIGFNICSGKRVTDLDEIYAAPRNMGASIVSDEFIFKLNDNFLSKSIFGSKEVLWQTEVDAYSKLIGTVSGLPVIYSFNSSTFCVYKPFSTPDFEKRMARASFGRAICLAKTGKYLDSSNELKRVLKADRNEREAYYWLGYVYSKMSKTKENIYAALISFDTYSNEPVTDLQREKYVKGFLLKYGGLKSKKSFVTDCDQVVIAEQGKTIALNSSLHYGAFLPEVSRIEKLQKNAGYIDDEFYYRAFEHDIEVLNINDGSLKSNVVLQGRILDFIVSQKRIYILSQHKGIYVVSSYNSRDAAKFWETEVPVKLSDSNRFFMVCRNGGFLLATDNKFKSDNQFFMISAKTGKLLWNKFVAPNLIVPEGQNRILDSSLTNIVFNGKYIFYSGAYCGEMQKIDAKTGGTINYEKVKGDVVGFSEYIKGEKILFSHAKLMCPCRKGSHSRCGLTPPFKVDQFLGKEVRGKKSTFSYAMGSIDTLNLSYLTEMSSEAFKYFQPYSKKRSLSFDLGDDELRFMDLSSGDLTERCVLPARKLCGFFIKDHSLFMLSGNNYHSKNKNIVNLYEFSSNSLFKNWTMKNGWGVNLNSAGFSK